MADDNWAHRSPNMACATCMWFVAKKPRTPLDPLSETVPTDLGRCRRRCPTMAGFPAVFRSDWCGDHKLDENKLV